MSGAQTHIPVGADKWGCGCYTWKVGTSFYLKPCGPALCVVQESIRDESKAQGLRTIVRSASTYGAGVKP